MKKREQTSQSAAVSQGALMWHQSITHPVRDAPASCPQRVEVRRPAECPHCRSVMQPAENQHTSTHSPQCPSLISGQPESACRSRRCLAKMLMAKSPLSQPQEENCTQTIYVSFMEYQTVSVVSTTDVSRRPFTSGTITGNCFVCCPLDQTCSVFLNRTPRTFVSSVVCKLHS